MLGVAPGLVGGVVQARAKVFALQQENAVLIVGPAVLIAPIGPLEARDIYATTADAEFDLTCCSAQPNASSSGMMRNVRVSCSRTSLQRQCS